MFKLSRLFEIFKLNNGYDPFHLLLGFSQVIELSKTFYHTNMQYNHFNLVIIVTVFPFSSRSSRHLLICIEGREEDTLDGLGR